jgi:hypothetical protein
MFRNLQDDKMNPDLWTPKQGSNFVRVLPAYPRMQEDFFLENREHGWVLMNIVQFQTGPDYYKLVDNKIQIWKTDVDVLYRLLDVMTRPEIGDITDIVRGRVLNVLCSKQPSKVVYSIHPSKVREPLSVDIKEALKYNLPNLGWVDKYLSGQIARKLNIYRRIDLG